MPKPRRHGHGHHFRPHPGRLPVTAAPGAPEAEEAETVTAPAIDLAQQPILEKYFTPGQKYAVTKAVTKNGTQFDIKDDKGAKVATFGSDGTVTLHSPTRDRREQTVRAVVECSAHEPNSHFTIQACDAEAEEQYRDIFAKLGIPESRYTINVGPQAGKNKAPSAPAPHTPAAGISSATGPRRGP